MNQQQRNEFARDIIKKNMYLTLGTADGDPWVAPLYYCADDHFTLYFMSQMDSLHTQHVLKNPIVAFAIFDSHQKEGTGNGVQGKGRVSLLKEDEWDEALRWYHTNYIDLTREVLVRSPYKFFKIKIEKLYILDPDEKSVDKRVEVTLT
jgi:uncharacterized protein YhbP (UPF0306 family)